MLSTLVAFGLLFTAQEPVRMTSDGSFKQHLQWSPDGLQFSMTRIHEGKMAIWTMTHEGKNLTRLLPSHSMPHFDAHWSRDSKQLVYVFDELQGTDGKLRIHVCTADGKEDHTLIPHKAFEESPRWSPDGKKLLWVSTRHGNPELYTLTIESKEISRLTSEIALDLHPNWSPDGKQIVFTSSRTGRQKIFRMNADGSEVKRLTDGNFLDSWPVWSPDGKQIAFVSNRTGNYDIWLMDTGGEQLRNLTQHPESDTSPAWSPDGKRLAFISTRGGSSEVYILPVK